MHDRSSILDPGGVAEGIAAQVIAHEPLVRWVVRRQQRWGLPFEEAVQAGRLALWRAVVRYDPARGTRFSSYAVPAITRAVWAAVARHRVAVRAVPQAAVLVDDQELGEALHAAAVVAALHALVGQLPPRLRQVVVGHYGLSGGRPQPFAASGQRLGVTRQRAEQLHAEALIWLAQPAHSLALRRLVGRDQRRDYQQARARCSQWLRARRGRGRGQR